MAPYLLHARHLVDLPRRIRPSAQDVTDWLERTLGSDRVRVERTGETTLEFHSKYRPFASSRSHDSLAFLARGEVEVLHSPDGPLITVRANPHIWDNLIPIVMLVWVLGWTNTTELLRWGAGLGGVALGGAVLLWTWSSLNTFLTAKVATLCMLRTRPLQDRVAEGPGAA